VEKKVKEGTETNQDAEAHPALPRVGPGLAASGIRKGRRRDLRGAVLPPEREEVEGESPLLPAVGLAVTPDGQGTPSPSRNPEDKAEGDVP